MNASKVKTWAQEYGADLVGIASAEQFAKEAPERNPTAIFPECRSVLVVGRRVLRGALRGIEEGTSFKCTYELFGFRYLEDNFLAQTVYDLTCRLEAGGVEAVPLFGYCEDGMPKGLPVSADKPAPNVYVDVDFAASAAGLGAVGQGGFFLTREYGTRQRFALILTDAELEPDVAFEGSVCDGCGECAAACPFGAITGEGIDYEVCRKCPNGAMIGPGRGSRPDRLAAACARACLVHLEGAGMCTSRFEHPFRKRTPWALDAFNRPVGARS
jgi:ferredoxin